tara:strand:+ start:5377 stop:5928 length:552 start_codon:yes stop_codon:yes gene_type:complete
MGVLTKRRNKLSIEERSYVWYVKEDDDSDACILHVISDDKRFNVQYALRQPDDRRFITVVGTEFNAIPASGVWRRFRCPKWENDGNITPGGVRALIDWSTNAETRLIELDNWGNPIPLRGRCESCGRDIRGMLGFHATASCYCDHEIAERVGLPCRPPEDGMGRLQMDNQTAVDRSDWSLQHD